MRGLSKFALIPPIRHVCFSRCSFQKSLATQVTVEEPLERKEFLKAKPFHQIPGPPRLPVIGNAYLYKLGLYDVTKYHLVLRQLHNKYGSLVRQSIGGHTIVHVFDIDDAKEVYHNEGKSPVVPPLQETTQLYRQQKGFSPGLGNSNGEEWYRLRSAVQQVLLRPKEVQQYLPSANSVAKDFVKRIRQKSDSCGSVDSLRDEVAKWSLESLGSVCFHKRLNFLEGGESEEIAQQMVDANKTIFHLSGVLKFSLPVYKYIATPKWRKLVKTEDTFYSQAAEYVRQTLNEIDSLRTKGELKDGDYSFLMYLLSRKELSLSDVTILTISLFVDGLSTTSPSLLFNLYCLATNPEVQEKAYREVRSAVLKDGSITPDVLNNLPYLKAVVKETFRLLPSGTEVSRIVQKDLVLSGYQVPSGTHVDINQTVNFLSEKYFSSPHEFQPERWMRGDSADSVDPYLLMPFGHGTRMCAGRRFAEQDIYVLLSHILLNFKLRYSGGSPLEQEYQTLLFPKGKLAVQFISR